MRTQRLLLVFALAANGLLAGASLDQSIKQLPARHRIGVVAFSAYSRAADLSNGVPFYASLGIGTALLSLIAGVVGLRERPRAAGLRGALIALIVLTLAHSLTTAFAAPTNFSQLSAGSDAALMAVFDRFEAIQAVRAVLQVCALVAAVVAVSRE